MLKDKNDSDEDARELVRLIRKYRLPAKVNLIPFNPWPGAAYECSTDERIRAFSNIVFEAGISAPVRTPRGRDIDAACGQLKTAAEKKAEARGGCVKESSHVADRQARRQAADQGQHHLADGRASAPQTFGSGRRQAPDRPLHRPQGRVRHHQEPAARRSAKPIWTGGWSSRTGPSSTCSRLIVGANRWEDKGEGRAGAVARARSG